MTESPTVELTLLRNFSPLDGLKNENLRALARKTTLRELTQGRLLFKEGDTDKRTFYLVAGVVELLTGGRIVGTVSAGTPDAKHPLAPMLPRRCVARVASDRIEYLSIDSDLLDVLITWDQTGTYEVGELKADGAGGDWMTVLLQSRAFHRVPPANLQAVFMRMQRVEVAAGDTIDPPGCGGRFLLRHRERSLHRDSRNATQPRRHQARRTRHGRYVRRGGPDLGRASQRHGLDADRRRADAPRQGRLQRAAERAVAAVGRLRRGAARGRGRRPLAGRTPAERVRALPLRRGAQRAALLRSPEAEDARSGGALRGLLRQCPSQLGGSVPVVRARIRRVRAEGRDRRHRAGGVAERDEPAS